MTTLIDYFRSGREFVHAYQLIRGGELCWSFASNNYPNLAPLYVPAGGTPRELVGIYRSFIRRANASCYQCGAYEGSDGEALELSEIDGELCCDSCRDGAYLCERCDCLTLTDVETINGEMCCLSCASQANTCDRCDHRTFDDLRTVDGDASWCERCVDRHGIWCERCEEYSSEGCGCDDCSSEHINRYHHSNVTMIHDARADYMVGVELEIVPSVDRDDLASELVDLGNVHCEEDSSLDEDGFEIVTNYGEINRVLGVCERIANTLKGRAKSHNTDCCGLHVHLSRGASTGEQVARFVVLWNCDENLAFLRLFTRRDAIERYCKLKHCALTSVEDGAGNLAESKDRYERINITYSETIEIRAFRGTTKRETLMACVQLAYLSWEYARAVKSLSDLHHTRFVEWLVRRGDASHVLTYLEQKGYSLPNPVPLFSHVELLQCA